MPRIHLGLCLKQTAFGDAAHFGVFCSNFIAKGVRFGPFQGKVVNASEVKTHRDNSRMWEVRERTSDFPQWVLLGRVGVLVPPKDFTPC